jgi:hypothetical protein
MHMMRKGQVKRLNGRDPVGQAKFVESPFSVAASARTSRSLYGIAMINAPGEV